LEIHDGDMGAVERVVDPPATAGDLVLAVVVWAQDPRRGLEERIDLALVPDVVAGRDDVDPGREQGFGRGNSQAHAAGDVLAVGGHEVDAPLIAKRRQDLLHGHPARLADEVADHQDSAGALWARRVPIGRVAEARSPDLLVHRGSLAAEAGRSSVRGSGAGY